MISVHRIVATLATITLATPLSAQARDTLARPVTPGDTVRLQEHATVLVHGVLLRRDSTGLVVVDRRTRDTVHIPIFQITRAQVQRGSHRRGGSAVGTGAAVGASIGGVILVLTIASPDRHEQGVAVFAAGLLTVVTTGIGTAVGIVASFTGTETWIDFDPTVVPSQSASAPP